MNKIISALNKAITKAGGAVNNAILESALKSLGWHVCSPMVWQPIETAPKDGNEFLAFMKIGTIEIVYYDEGFRVDSYAPPAINENWMTHWMPLPEEPQ